MVVKRVAHIHFIVFVGISITPRVRLKTEAENEPNTSQFIEKYEGWLTVRSWTRSDPCPLVSWKCARRAGLPAL